MSETSEIQEAAADTAGADVPTSGEQNAAPTEAGVDGAANPSATQNVPPADLGCRIEAALLTTDRPLPSARLSEIMGNVSAKAIRQAIDELNTIYEQSGRSFRIEQVADGWQILTLPQYADVLASLNRQRATQRLSPAAMETLAIIAYKQPILRAELEAIRGVACGEVIRSLLERRLIKIVGRAEELGRPMLYGTTRSFLEVFGLAGLKDLPKVEELKLLKRPQPSKDDETPTADDDRAEGSTNSVPEQAAQAAPDATDDGQATPASAADDQPQSPDDTVHSNESSETSSRTSTP